ncbi:hypothetical protein SARC_09366 [Sphaeroforma arctica JP610]|uniref:Uncharacterized protein n=1 Tax=Sphaeroforma arctica JP610 TaxID=667725 RepID=A0A0L0FNZ9_9EUKA|nr:hypothetical protein SARC_09366 [Sphaeroforma arctica JP610]KNC78196.1 hypothetical protein SARC_09366 [Sphaeroforma arctica JP610]|eukprot:XP_014152098.1 hypothetical protein SARC_09366 [Sphaeroforma arctica JP610]
MTRVEIFTSSVSGNRKVDGETKSIKMFFDAHKIEYKEIDISLDENEDKKKYLLAKSGSRTIPKVFVDDEFKGDYETLMYANEDGLLKQSLGLE